MSRFPDDALALGFSKRVLVGNTSGATGSTASLPNTLANTTAGCVLIASTVATFIRLGQASTVTCSTSTDILISPNDHYVLKTAGWGFIAALSDSTGFMGITAVEIG